MKQSTALATYNLSSDLCFMRPEKMGITSTCLFFTEDQCYKKGIVKDERAQTESDCKKV